MIAGSLEIKLFADMSRIAKDMHAVRNTVGGSMEAVEKAVGAAKAALGGLGAGLGLSQIINLTDQYTKFTAQLQLATNTTSEYARAYADVQRIAKTAQADLGGTGVLYARIAQGTRELGMSQSKVADITETVSLALKVSGATAAESSSAMLQLSQAFASGTLRGEEFNAINEAAPRLMQALADGLGVPVGALKKMAEEGKLTTEAVSSVTKALPELRNESDKIQTISGAFTELKNEVLQFVGVQAQASGAVSVMTGGIKLLAENLGLLAGVTLTVTASKLAQWMGAIAAKTLEDVAASRAKALAVLEVAKADARATASASALATARVAELRSAVLATNGEVALAVATNGLIPAQTRAATASAAHATSLSALAVAQRAASLGAAALNGALGLLGGPIGAITTILGLGATAWMLWGKSSDDANKQAQASTEASGREILAGLDKQIEKLRERVALAKAGNADIAKAGGADAEKLASTLKQINDLKSKGNTITGVDQIQLIELQGVYDDISKKVGSVKGLNEELATIGQNAKAADFWKEHATNAQKATTEVEKWKKALGSAFTPEIETTIRAKYAEKTPRSSGGSRGKSEAEKQAEEAAKFIERLTQEKETLGLSTIELAKYQAIKAHLSPEQQKIAVSLAAEVEMLKAVDEARKSAAKAEAEAAAAAQQQIATAFEAVSTLQHEIQTYDMLPAAITRAEIAKLELLKSTLEANEGTAEEIRVTEALIEAKNRLAGLQSAKTELDKQKENVAELKKIQDNFVENVQSNLGRGLFDMMNGNFKSIGDSFKTMLLQMAAEAAAANITAALFGSKKDSGSSGLLSGALDAAMGYFGIAGARANGGQVNAGSTYLVGEKEAETFKPSVRGLIVAAISLPKQASLAVNEGGNFTPKASAVNKTEEQRELAYI